MIDTVKEFEHIKPLVADEVTPEQLYIFTVHMCNNEIDSDFDKFTPEFLSQFSERINAGTAPLIKDHTWCADGQIGRVYRAEVLSEGENSLGEPFTYVLGYAYVAADSEVVPRIKLGLLSEVSVGFDGKDYTCSVCGVSVLSHDHQCPNGHTFGLVHEETPIYRNVGTCLSALECSFVPVPAQEGAEIQSKSKEGRKVKKSVFLKALGLKSKKAAEETEEVVAEETPMTDEEETKAKEETPEAEVKEEEVEEVKEETPTEEDPEVSIADIVQVLAELKASVDELKSAKIETEPVQEVKTKTKARTQYVQEQPVTQTGIKARVSQAGSGSTVEVKAKTPYVTERTF